VARTLPNGCTNDFAYIRPIRNPQFMNSIGAVTKYIVSGAVIAIALIGFTIAYPMLSKTNNGILALQITDPPEAPAGVTSVVIQYSDIYVHAANAGRGEHTELDGWYKVAGSGSIDLMSVVNVTETIGATALPDGTYNGIRFNVTSATITYNGTKYPATVPHGWINVPIKGGGVSISTGNDAGVVVDLAPTIIISNENGVLHFNILPYVRGYPVPGTAFHKEYEHDGYKVSKEQESFIYKDEDEDSGHIAIQSAMLNGTSLSINVKNIGSNNVTLTHVFMSGLSQYSMTSGNITIYGELQSYQMFAVISHGSLEVVGNETLIMTQYQSGQIGYVLTPNSTITLTYSNPYGIQLLNPHYEFLYSEGALVAQTQPIIVGQSYYLTIGGFPEAEAMYNVQAT
jgi:hypothetical protein